jgi:hypothetical protein
LRYSSDIGGPEILSDSLQVRGTPGSGKTVLAQLLAQYVLRRDPDMNVIWVNGWSLEEVEESGGLFSYLEKKGWAPDRNTLLIFDDAEASYKDTYLWGHFFKSIHEWNNRRAITFSSYGTPSPRISVPGMLIQWNNSQKVTLHPIDHGYGLPTIGLLFSREEFDDLISRQYPNPDYHFDSSFFDSVFDLTEGHVGAVLAFMTVVISHDVGPFYLLGTSDDLIAHFSRIVSSSLVNCTRGTPFGTSCSI